ncbi:hypothetical protein [Pedobacter sp. SG918]|uniref:hypothetical protein n=1 Tax=Pedobacter sp. SG918 TaxID=2587136 RepID=UPI00146DD495|nr:hypothetical protein [Pedobacter sp. SG918]NII82095.1 hypothetical protein [Pedobacter sp. SG908]NMN36102.1 hypothetical protein [Pedobacter sp. SG918]
MMEGENVKAFAPPFNLPLRRGSTPSPILHRGLVLTTKKALTNLSDISSKPFSYALVFVVFNGRHAFAALRLVTFSSRKK